MEEKYILKGVLSYEPQEKRNVEKPVIRGRF
jgi:hypothetical protein